MKDVTIMAEMLSRINTAAKFIVFVLLLIMIAAFLKSLKKR